MAAAIARHLTAIERTTFSRPIQLALKDELIKTGTTVLDYGCGRGGDVGRLAAQGIDCVGWDPVHRPDGQRRPSDVVNMGYVVNVIEDATERATALQAAWALADSLLIVSGRLEAEARPGEAVVHTDGYVTRLGTFQKLYQQHELRDWIDSVLGAGSIPAGPGVFYVFREESARQGYLAARHRRIWSVPRIRRCDELYERHKDILQPLLDFLCARGRLPQPTELAPTQAIVDTFGSVRSAFRVLRSVLDESQWNETNEHRTQDLLIYLALSRFSHRPRFSDLPPDLQADIRAFFTSYHAACELADAMLFAAGDIHLIAQLCRKSQVGKQTPAALYVHESALPDLDPVLRLYEGCARSYIGSVEGANLIKLHRGTPQVSYLSYPNFDKDPHPALSSSLVVPLQTFRVELRSYENSENPPILHRKEEFVGEGYPLREKFARLTEQEKRYGLYLNPAMIGTRDGWLSVLRSRAVALHGHRVVRERIERIPG